MSLRDSLRDIEDFGVRVWPETPSADVLPERLGVVFADSEDWCWSSSAAAKISAEAITRRSEDVYICSQKRIKKSVAMFVLSRHRTDLYVVEDIFVCALL